MFRAAIAGVAPVTMAATPSSGVEALLRAQRPEVERWQVRPLAENVPVTAEAVRLGKLGVRTAVRFSDGRVRWYAIEGYREVLVSAHRIESGVAVGGEDARLESRDVIALGCAPLRELPQTKGWRTRRALAEGEALCASTIEPSPDVERNGPVKLTAGSGGIQVSRVLTAASDARTGERVRLRDAATGISLIGIVTGPGAARVAGEIK
jgi:flagella basal body P-ring formation protein FlgA